ncbi:hypothetical protein RBG61_04665 [Paludicola sp. MB14-C6]|uniref:hypothetical protein n=1 Tax=Paludihabitans sp. MB14-C6 TaxID=3070656 RepID=UPI0027DADC65|nr:hypothetical protein [Paludicola sp. MB14-C6]WMJ23966.1 hypothetical protein RBG61_04665 [Paludicola sp. MB14-C6]
MNLKQNQITVEELLRNPQAKAILQKELPEIMKLSLVKMAGKMTLQQVLEMNKGYVPSNQVNRILKQLEQI